MISALLMLIGLVLFFSGSWMMLTGDVTIPRHGGGWVLAVIGGALFGFTCLLYFQLL